MKKIAAVAAVAASLTSAPAFAQWYIGLGIGSASTSFSPAGVTVDDNDVAGQFRAGYRFHPNYALEAGYYYLGEYGLSAGTASAAAQARSVGLSLVGIVPLERWELYGRLGYARSELDVDAHASNLTVSARARENEWFGGIGARYRVASDWAVFAEWQKHDKLEVDAFFIGVDLKLYW